MSSVLGVSVGASAVRLTRPEAGGFELQAVDVTIDHRSEDVAAESVGVAFASGAPVTATAIAYRSEQQARAIESAMARQNLTNFQLIPETTAVVEHLHSTGALRGYATIAIYDLGSSGLTVSIVDTSSRAVLYAERTTEISGDYFDTLVREQQIAAGRIKQPQSRDVLAALDAHCRDAKEQLSEGTAVALPCDTGVVLISRENFDALITLAVESSARLTRDVIMRSEQPVQAIVAVGGGARIPLVQQILRNWLAVPVLVPAEPETVAARGASLLARPVAPPPAEPTPMWLDPAPRESRRREISGAGLAVTALVVVAAIGIGLWNGGQVLERNESGDSPTTTIRTTPPRTTTMEPSIAGAPVQTITVSAIATPPPAVAEPVRSTTTTPPPPPPPSTPAPNVVEIPGLPPITLPTLPPPPPPPTIPPLPPIFPPR